MADKTIGELTRASELYDDSLLIAEQNGEAVSVPGSLLKYYAQQGVDAQVAAAKESADRAEQAAKDAEEIVASIEYISDDAEAAKAAALAAENAKKEAESQASSASKSAENANNSEQAAATSATNAANSEKTSTTKAQEAASSATAAKTSETNAKTSETNAANSASAAKESQDAADQSASAANASASSAASSAESAQQTFSQIETYLEETRAAAKVSLAASEAAGTSEVNASDSAKSAATSATNASESMQAAKAAQAAAELARDEAISAGGTGGGAGSWEDLGEGIGFGVLLEETTLTATNTKLTKDLPLTAGNEYTVTWNGTEYVCTATDVSALSGVDGSAYVGNFEGSASGEPFCIHYTPGTGTTVNIAIGSAPATVSVTGVGTVIIPIPGKYLPKGTPWIDGEVYLDESYASSFTHPSFGTMWRIYKAVKLKVGETYTVIYNGTSYNCACQAAPSGLIEDPDAVAMGNFSVVGGANTGEPFAMLISYDYREVDIVDLSSASSVECAIHAVGTTISKIDEACLPDVFRVTGDGATMTADKSLEEVEAAFMSGKRVYFIADGSIGQCASVVSGKVAVFKVASAHYTNDMVTGVGWFDVALTADKKIIIQES